MTQYFLSILIGVLSGLASSALFLWFLTKLRPKIIISEYIAFDEVQIEGTKKSCYRFKIVNKTWFSKIYDVEAQLVLITLINADGGFNIFLSPIDLIKDKSWSLNRISKNDKHAEFAFQFITLEDIKSKWGENQNIELRVKAKHAFSGFSKIEKKRYYKSDLAIKKGSFKFGTSTEIS